MDPTSVGAFEDRKTESAATDVENVLTFLFRQWPYIRYNPKCNVKKGNQIRSYKLDSQYVSYYIYTDEMFTEGVKRSAMFVANATSRFMSRMIRDPHVFHQVFFLVELPITPSTLVPACIHMF